MRRPVAMAALLERLRAALLPELEIEREVASGGMGTVFEARDPLLSRRVAVKILRPELATARAAEQFLAEARTLASLSHPNVVPIHAAGEAGGFSYYVMDYVEGPTLAGRLAEGPLPPRAAVRMGRELLAALAAVHATGVVHRDIKPGNVFLQGQRALLGDFGLAVSGEAAGGDRVQGTPDYMAPEQRGGGPVTTLTDLYAVGLVLYEAFTARRWSAGEWAGVPRNILPVLRRALASEPADRWPDAATFGEALRRAALRPRQRRAYLATAGIAVLGIAGALAIPRGTGSEADVAILPFAVAAGLEEQWEAHLPRLAEANIDVVRVAPSWSVLRASAASPLDTASLYGRLGVRWLVSGTVGAVADSFVIRLVATSARGTRRESAAIRIRRGDMHEIGCRLGSEIVLLIDRQLVDAYTCNLALQGSPSEAVRAWLDGERAFQLQAWATAERHYLRALALDPEFTHAQWGLLNARRWLRTLEYADIDRLWRDHRDQLAERDRALLDADRTFGLRERFATYEALLVPDRYRQDAYAWLLYGNDLFHRGGLLGIPLDSAATVLAGAVRLDSTLGPAWFQLAWALIRMGRRAEAGRAVTRLAEVSGSEAAVPPPFMELVRLERFAPDTAAVARQQFLGPGVWNEDAAALSESGLRWGLSFNTGRAQAEIAEALLGLDGIPPDARRHAHEAMGLALVATGRPLRGLAHFDTAAALFGSPEARLQADLWRLALPALAEVDLPDSLVAAARERVMRAAPATLATGAHWMLALAAFASGDTVEGESWRRRLAAGPTVPGVLTRLLDAEHLASLGDVQGAVRLAESVAPEHFLGTEGALADTRRPYPFSRAALYMRRAEWRERLGDRAAARDWLWYENADLAGWPNGPAQAGEVDWALGTYAALRRARLAFTRGEERQACSLLSHVLDAWRRPDAAVAALAADADRLLRERCR